MGKHTFRKAFHHCIVVAISAALPAGLLYSPLLQAETAIRRANRLLGPGLLGAAAAWLGSSLAGPILAVEAAPEAEKAPPKAQTVCPVMGGEINKDIFADHDGKRVSVGSPRPVALTRKDSAVSGIGDAIVPAGDH